jgi:diketogulonate reductase-like aldo/keto reductase
MIELQQDGLVRSIGVCNFTEEMLQRLFDATGGWPSVNQVELHPYFPQTELRAFHETHGILTEAWSPLGRKSDLLDNVTVAALAAAKGVTSTQLVLRWHVQQGIVAIPKSANPDRQRENLDVFSFELSADELATLTALQRGRIWGADPNTHEEM